MWHPGRGPSCSTKLDCVLDSPFDAGAAVANSRARCQATGGLNPHSTPLNEVSLDHAVPPIAGQIPMSCIAGVSSPRSLPYLTPPTPTPTAPLAVCSFRRHSVGAGAASGRSADRNDGGRRWDRKADQSTDRPKRKRTGFKPNFTRAS